MASTLKCSVLLLVLLAGCTVEGKIDPKEIGRRITCKDLRDGETFTYIVAQGNPIVRVGFAGAETTGYFVDITGKHRSYTKAQLDRDWKCE